MLKCKRCRRCRRGRFATIGVCGPTTASTAQALGSSARPRSRAPQPGSRVPLLPADRQARAAPSTWLPSRSRPTVHNNRRGTTLLEILAALSVTALVGATLAQGLRTWQSAAILENARRTVIESLLEARRLAYRSDTDAAVALVDAHTLELRSPDRDATSIRLPRGVSVVGAPSDGDVRFRASGLADNATLVLRSHRSVQEARIVVNQRGMVR